MKKLGIEDIKSILKLLDEPNQNVYKLIESQLLNCISEYSSYLKEYEKETDNYLVKNRIKDIFHKNYLNNIEDLFRNLPLDDKGDIDLEYASLLVSTIENSDFDKQHYINLLNEMAENIKPEIENITDPLILIEKVNDYLFKKEGFSGNQIDYTDPNNTFINMVIDRRTGIPITLSLIYLFLAKRLKLNFFGVGMPGHFILKYQKDNFEIFVDPYYSGQLLTKKDCINFLNFSGYGFVEEYLNISSNKEILKRMIRNLLVIYKENNDDYKYNKLRDVLSIVDISY